MKYAAVLIALALSFSLNAQAKPAASEASTVARVKIDPAALAAARELLVTVDIKTMMSNMADALIPIEVAAIHQQNPNVSQEAIDIFTATFRQEFKSGFGRFQDIYANMYAEHFSAAELRQLNAFDKSPLGQKVLHQLPGLMREVQPLAIAFGEQVGERVRERVNAQLQKKGQSL